MYSFSPKLKSTSIILLVVGLVLFGIGFFLNKGISTEEIEHMMEAVHASGHNAPTHSSEMVGPQDHAAHLEHATLQVHNQPLAAIHFVAVFFFGVSCCLLFFYSFHHASYEGLTIFFR